MPISDDGQNPTPPSALSRRAFIRSGVAAGAGMMMANPIPAFAQNSKAKGEDLNVAIIGTGAQGRVLIDAALGIPGIRFKAVCDIWEYSQRYGERYLGKNGHAVTAYTDYRDMLAKEPDLDAVIVATPDFVHAEHAIACMEAGHHVYCEKLMSNTAEAARRMVKTSQETGRLLQIGHQRRSNPRYQHALHNLLGEARLLGRITNVNAQWNRAVTEDLGWPEKYTMDQDTLARYGYANMHEYRNWRWYRKYGGGPISDLGAHQIDIFNWFLGANPSSVMAGGGIDYYKNHEWYDNVMAIYEFPTSEGMVRAFYQVLTTTSAGGGYFEYFMGTDGSLKISENPKITAAYQEAHAPDWDEWVRKGYIIRSGSADDPKPWEKKRSVVVDARETAQLAAWKIPIELNKAIHQPHLENFFDAIRHGVPLNCPGEQGYASCVTVLKVNEAVAAERKLDFKASDFVV
ncbi:MAG: Gfo/Idh/MocA family oxidoreductase [Opitutaceae bacterium]